MFNAVADKHYVNVTLATWGQLLLLIEKSFMLSKIC